MRSHDLDYRIIGDDIQLVEIELDTKETVIAEAGTMMYMDSQVRFETKMGDGSEPNQGLMGKLLSAGTRVLTSELDRMTFEPQFSPDGKHIWFLLEDSGELNLARIKPGGTKAERMIRGMFLTIVPNSGRIFWNFWVSPI